MIRLKLSARDITASLQIYFRDVKPLIFCSALFPEPVQIQDTELEYSDDTTPILFPRLPNSNRRLGIPEFRNPATKFVFQLINKQIKKVRRFNCGECQKAHADRELTAIIFRGVTS